MPRSLFGRVAMILFGALALAHGLTYLAILRERGDLAQNMMLAYLGRDVASAVAILDRVPAAERAQWLPRLERQNYRYALREAAQSTALAGELPRQLSQVVAAQVGAQRVGTMTLMSRCRSRVRRRWRALPARSTPCSSALPITSANACTRWPRSRTICKAR